jgi:hypothetical protein
MKIKVDKLGVAHRQINTAVDLWFSGGDAISIHTLVAAAYQILCDLLKNKNLPDFLYNKPISRHASISCDVGRRGGSEINALAALRRVIDCGSNS